MVKLCSTKILGKFFDWQDALDLSMIFIPEMDLLRTEKFIKQVKFILTKWICYELKNLLTRRNIVEAVLSIGEKIKHANIPSQNFLLATSDFDKA